MKTENHPTKMSRLKEEETMRREADLNEVKTVEQMVDHIIRYYGSQNKCRPFLEFAETLQPADFWKLVSNTYPGLDDIFDHTAQLLRLLNRNLPAQYYNEEDQKFFDNLPDVIDVFRGSDISMTHGLSWTTDRKVAQEFARGHRRIFNENPTISHGKIRKDQIVFSFGSRWESEVILNPSQLTDVWTSQLQQAA